MSADPDWSIWACNLKRFLSAKALFAKENWKARREFVGLLWLVFVIFILWQLLGGLPNISKTPELLRGIGFFILGFGIAPLGLWLANSRTATSQIQALTEKDKVVTEAFAKYVELLGNEREAARQGGIYALGRLAGEDKKLHPIIMDIVASYIRQESRDQFFSEKKESEKRENKPIKDEAIIDTLSSKPTSMDIEAAIAVIRERNTKYDKKPRENPRRTPRGNQYIMDLSNAYVFNADFSNTMLSKVNFSDSVMMNCIFEGTDISGSNFIASDLTDSDMTQKQVDRIKTTGDWNEKTIFPKKFITTEE